MTLDRFSLLALVIAAGPSIAQTPPAVGIGEQDRRGTIAITEAPWSSLVLVQTDAGSRCTGAVIAARRVVTAAHCLVAPRTGKLVRADRVHVLLGYSRGEYVAHARATEMIIGPGFDPTRRGPAGADWAILLLDRALPAAPLPMATAAPPGSAAMLAGWQRDRAHVLLADTSCIVEGQIKDAGGTLLRHSCAATRGASGGPLLVREAGGWAIAGIAVAANRDARGGIAVPAATLAPHLARAR